jgi:DNA invertase Pin-like site-specific DNA recombinase
VSSDEQNNGYSPLDQRIKLETYCQNHDIQIMGIFHDDESGKSFNRPEWIKIMSYIKSNKGLIDYIYFLKWDRFSRNATEAYAELAKLRKLGVEARAMEQPLDFEIPEQKILLSIYLTAPEVDNDRRALNIFNGIRRAKKEGRWIGPRPLGYRNSRDEFNKPVIVPEGGAVEELVKNLFKEFATGLYSPAELRAKYNRLGLKLSLNPFANLLRNKVYIGKVFVPKYKDESERWVNGKHQAIIDEKTFMKCQDVIEGRKRKVPISFKTHREQFPLRGFLVCPQCGKLLTASSSKGRNRYYAYYHCQKGCTERHNAKDINDSIEKLLNEITPDKAALNLLNEIIKNKYKDQNREQREEATKISKEIAKQDVRLQNARTLMLDGEITADEFKSLKTDIDNKLVRLQIDHRIASTEIKNIDGKLDQVCLTLSNLKNLYKQGDLGVKRRLIGSMFPQKLTYEKKSYRTVELNRAVSLIISNIKGSRGRKKKKHTDFGVLHHGVESEVPTPISIT